MTSKKISILTPCPKTPNCVSSMSADKTHFIEPITYKEDRSDARHAIVGILNSMNRVRVVKLEENYIHAEFVSFLFRFVDDVEFYFDDEQKLIQVKSASRVGHSDLGANRRRVEKIRKEFEGGKLV